MSRSPNSLRRAFDFKLSEILGWDLLVGLLGGGGSVWVAISSPAKVSQVVPIAAAVVGIVVGAVVAGVAVLAAFLDQGFLRKLRMIGREPVRYIAPFTFTAALGIVAALFLLVLAVVPATPTWLIPLWSGVTGWLVVWTLASVLPNLSLLIEFVGLQFDASEVPDIPPTPPARPNNPSQEGNPVAGRAP
jgi:hypothetical protein